VPSTSAIATPKQLPSREIASVSRVLVQGNWLAGLKVAVAMLIGGGDTLVAPFEPIDDTGRERIRQVLVELGLTPV